MGGAPSFDFEWLGMFIMVEICSWCLHSFPDLFYTTSLGEDEHARSDDVGEVDWPCSEAVQTLATPPVFVLQL